jgi:hypothetical protein
VHIYATYCEGLTLFQINPVELIERLQKAKQDFKMLVKESDEIESREKVP